MAPITLLGTPTVQNQLLTGGVTSAVVPKDVPYETASMVTSFFTAGLVGGYGFVSALAFANTDRPIGLMPGGSVLDYQDRLVVITREKLQSLAVGAGITVAVPFAEPFDGALNGLYTLYLRVERVQ